jgi:hypothetical protein
VDLIAIDAAGHRVGTVAESLRALLETDGGEDARGEVGVDQGTGAAREPVIGMSFWVRADDVGSAASVAVETGVRAGASHGVGPALYDVTVIPREAVVLSEDPHYPEMPD